MVRCTACNVCGCDWRNTAFPKGGRPVCGHSRRETYERVTVMKKPTPRQEEAIAAGEFADEGFAKKYPHLTEYLVTDKWENGEEREPSTFTVSHSAHGVQVAVNDKDQRQSLYSTAGTLTEALKLADKAIGDGIDAWRQWGGGKGKKKGK